LLVIYIIVHTLQLRGYLGRHFIGIYGQTKQMFPFQWLLRVSYSDIYMSHFQRIITSCSSTTASQTRSS